MFFFCIALRLLCVKSKYELIMKINEIYTAMKMAVLLGQL